MNIPDFLRSGHADDFAYSGSESMSSVLKLILEGGCLSTEQMAQILGMSVATVEAEVAQLKEDKVLLGWRPVLNPDHDSEHRVRAVIEVKIQPQRDGGFDKLAQRISKFERVESCYLMSGGYDLLVIVQAENLHRVASFVFEKLATIEGVIATATHFMLRPYKEQGYMIEAEAADNAKPPVSP